MNRVLSHARTGSDLAVAPPVLQRACDCGKETPVQDGKCASCTAKEQFAKGPGLTIGPQDDIYEQEADRVADQVVAGSSVTAPLAGAITQLQRQPAEEEEEPLQTKRERLQRQTEEEEEELLQPKAQGRSAPRSSQAAAPAAAAVATGGKPLSRSERAYFEPRFGRNLSAVRLHTDSSAGQAAKGIGARAYTLRNHIAFAAGQYRPGTTEGHRLMAHELTHTLQQGFGGTIRRVPDGMGMDLDDDMRRRDPFAPPHMEDPRGHRGSTLTYAQSRELNNCIEVMGDSEVAAAECANVVLGTPIPEWKSVAGTSSPVPFRAQVSSAGVATHRIGRVNLTILPDVRTSEPAMQDKAKTEIIPQPLATGTNLVDGATMNGRVTSFTVNPAAFNLTIKTTYGPGVSASSTSGYGRGTTAADQSTGSTSLGFHEGEHGRDFITFLQNNPYPEFTGRNGQTAGVFSARITRFETALQDYVRLMNRTSELATDCTGTTIDSFNTANGTATTTCVHQPGDP